jgi:hypothetical protein
MMGKNLGKAREATPPSEEKITQSGSGRTTVVILLLKSRWGPGQVFTFDLTLHSLGI